jgi:flagellar motor switch protein FliG
LALTGKQKAAMLLMSLDAATAAELIKGLDTEVARELALELAGLDAADVKRSGKSTKIVKQFHHSLKTKETFQFDGFLGELLKSTVGRNRTEQIRIRIQQVICNPDLASGPEQSLRELAVILRDLDKEIRDGLLNAIHSRDRLTGEMIKEFMREAKISS